MPKDYPASVRKKRIDRVALEKGRRNANVKSGVRGGHV